MKSAHGSADNVLKEYEHMLNMIKSVCKEKFPFMFMILLRFTNDRTNQLRYFRGLLAPDQELPIILMLLMFIPTYPFGPPFLKYI